MNNFENQALNRQPMSVADQLNVRRSLSRIVTDKFQPRTILKNNRLQLHEATPQMNKQLMRLSIPPLQVPRNSSLLSFKESLSLPYAFDFAMQKIGNRIQQNNVMAQMKQFNPDSEMYVMKEEQSKALIDKANATIKLYLTFFANEDKKVASAMFNIIDANNDLFQMYNSLQEKVYKDSKFHYKFNLLMIRIEHLNRELISNISSAKSFYNPANKQYYSSQYFTEIFLNIGKIIEGIVKGNNIGAYIADDTNIRDVNVKNLQYDDGEDDDDDDNEDGDDDEPSNYESIIKRVTPVRTTMLNAVKEDIKTVSFKMQKSEEKLQDSDKKYDELVQEYDGKSANYRELVSYSNSSARVREDPATIRALEEARQELVSINGEINMERERSKQLQLELEESQKELTELNEKVKILTSSKATPLDAKLLEHIMKHGGPTTFSDMKLTWTLPSFDDDPELPHNQSRKTVNTKTSKSVRIVEDGDNFAAEEGNDAKGTEEAKGETDPPTVSKQLTFEDDVDKVDNAQDDDINDDEEFQDAEGVPLGSTEKLKPATPKSAMKKPKKKEISEEELLYKGLPAKTGSMPIPSKTSIKKVCETIFPNTSSALKKEVTKDDYKYKQFIFAISYSVYNIFKENPDLYKIHKSKGLSLEYIINSKTMRTILYWALDMFVKKQPFTKGENNNQDILNAIAP